MVKDLSYNLCESLVENIDGVAGIGKKTPTPIYLTQWKIVGNSEVHTLPYPDGVVLPTGYKRCEYLTFDGNSYINTGVKTANDIGYNISCTVNEYNIVLIGGRISSSSAGFCCGYFNPRGSGGGIYYAYGNNTQRTDIIGSYVDGRKHTILFDNSIYQIDDEIISINRGTATEFADIYVGTWNNGGTPDSRMWKDDIYDTIIYNTQGELWHGIPCLDANDVPCFYDIVSQTAFYNQGSGSFTYKLYPQPTEIWSCGEYSAVDGKYHVVILPTGKQAVDIVLDEPLRKTGNTADTLEYPTETSGKALLTIRVEESGGELSPLDTPTTELIDAPQIQEAESYSCVISQGGKAVEWSSFETE